MMIWTGFRSVSSLTHLHPLANTVQMVNVAEKQVTSRHAVATGRIRLNKEAFEAIMHNRISKGNVKTIAQIAGICGAKKTSELIPLCHQVPLDVVSVEFTDCAETHTITAIGSAQCGGKTGVEMEALTAVSVALLTIYDMSKALSRESVISDIMLARKTGGASGDYVHGKQPH